MALLDDVATQMGTSVAALTEVQQARLALAITDTEYLIAKRFPGVNIDRDRADRVIRWAVAEWAAQPSSRVVAKEVGVDDARTMTRWSDGESQTLEDVLAQWWDHLDPAATTGHRGAFSVSPAYAPDMRWGRERWSL